MNRKVLVGMLLLGALFIFGLATLRVKNWQFFFSKGLTIEARFPVVHTLDNGDLVRMSGVAVGTVRSVDIRADDDPGHPVRAQLWIQEGVGVRSDDEAVVRVASIFGGTYISIERGDPQARLLMDGDRIARTRVAPSMTEVVEHADDTLKKVGTAFDQVSSLTDEVRSGKGVAAKLLTDEEMAKKVDTIVADAGSAVESLKATAERVERGEGVLGKLTKDEAMADDLRAFLRDAHEVAINLRSLSEDLREGEGTLGRLIQDEELSNEVAEAVSNLREITRRIREGDGTLARLVNDPEMADEVRGLVADARAAAENLRAVTESLREGEAGDKLQRSLDDLNAFTAALVDTKGTVGKLVMTDEAYGKLLSLVDAVQSIVDTYREQSPVITFAGAVFGAF